MQGGFYSTEQSSYSSSRTKKSGLSLAVEIHNLSQMADTAKLEWYFFGTRVNQSTQFIFDSGSQDVSMEKASVQAITLESKSLMSKEERHLTTGSVDPVTGRELPPTASTQKSGSKMVGWLVRLVVDGQVYQVRASSPSLESIGKSDTQLAAFPKQVNPVRFP